MAYQEQHQGKLPSPSPQFRREQPNIGHQRWMHHPSYPELYNPTPDIYEKTRLIADLPLVRLLLLRPGKQLDLLHNVSKGILNYQAALAYQRGTLRVDPCERCANWCGPFQNCITLDNNFFGSCANCVYQGSGSRCSLRHDSGGVINVNDRSEEEEVATRHGGSTKEPNSPSRKRHAADAYLSPLGYVRRKAAVNAEIRLSNYGSGGGDIVAEQVTTNDGVSSISNVAWSLPSTRQAKSNSGPILGCDQSFDDPENIPRHIRSGHTQEKAHTCPECKKTFTRTDNLSVHRQKFHLGDSAAANYGAHNSAEKVYEDGDAEFDKGDSYVDVLKRTIGPHYSSNGPHGKVHNSIFTDQGQEDFLFLQRRKDPSQPNNHRLCVLARIARCPEAQVKNWFRNEARPQRGEDSIRRERNRLAWLDEQCNKPTNPSATSADISGKQTSTLRATPTISQTKDGNPPPVKSGSKECNTCHEVKAIFHFREAEGRGMLTLPDGKKADCIPCEDIERKVMANISSHTSTGQTTASIGSIGQRGQPSSRGELQPPREGSNRFTAKRGGVHSSSHTRHNYAPATSGNSTINRHATSTRPVPVAATRYRFTAQQWDVLDAEHERNLFPSDGRFHDLAATLGCTRDQVRNWFRKRNRANPTGTNRPNDDPSSQSDKSLSAVSQKRTTPLETSNDSDQDEPVTRRRKTINFTSGNSATAPITDNTTPRTESTPATAKTILEVRDAESSSAGGQPAQPKPSVTRTQRYLKALAEAEMCSRQEQELELAGLKFRTSVLSNVIENITPESRTSRYQMAEAEMVEMSSEEHQFELASLKFQLSVMQDAIANRNSG